jgi:hypothetical protein
MDCFYLGTHRPYWLWNPEVQFPLFVSHHTLSSYVTLQPATCGWALDSGGFTELSRHGRWLTTPAEYVRAVARYDQEIGSLEWAAPQDWMCEPEIVNGGGRLRCPGTRLSVGEHQRRTVANFLELSALWPEVSDTECPFVPVLQGRPGDPDSYLACTTLYETAGVCLFDHPVVGVGSVCRIQATSRVRLVSDALASVGLGPAARNGDDYPPSLHWFGLKRDGIAQVWPNIGSSDSMAWSYGARRAPRLAGCTHRARNCAGCLTFATRWRDHVLTAITDAEQRAHQAPLDLWSAA